MQRITTRRLRSAALIDSPEHAVPLAPVFDALAAGGFRGTVIVQGHGWTADTAAMLRRCAESFRQLTTPTTLRTNNSTPSQS